ncbi:MAG: hypothetical protein HeimC3_03100 [Candidatus Heimdallarchaeota archaeon LC_3]|nr:MAG: hypothetical protein HeimC3_03100 [Candidatus Heimdallarchaeota archaeon LC_3]
MRNYGGLQLYQEYNTNCNHGHLVFLAPFVADSSGSYNINVEFSYKGEVNGVLHPTLGSGFTYVAAILSSPDDSPLSSNSKRVLDVDFTNTGILQDTFSSGYGDFVTLIGGVQYYLFAEVDILLNADVDNYLFADFFGNSNHYFNFNEIILQEIG